MASSPLPEPAQSTYIPLEPARGLSQMERVVNTFIAPRKTFTDILRSTSWWLPFLLVAVFSLASAAVVDRQVGFDRVAENNLHASARQEERLNQLAPEQKAQQMAITAKVTRATTYSFVFLILLVNAVYALLVWAAFNFGLGARTTFSQVLAVTWYSALPLLVLFLLSVVTLFAGGDPENFMQQNPVGTNPGYYLPDVAPALRVFLTQLDIIRLWSLVLMVIGMAVVAGKTIGRSAMIVVGFWVVTVLLQVGITAAFS